MCIDIIILLNFKKYNTKRRSREWGIKNRGSLDVNPAGPSFGVERYSCTGENGH
jgi:hypothetical protein